MLLCDPLLGPLIVTLLRRGLSERNLEVNAVVLDLEH